MTTRSERLTKALAFFQANEWLTSGEMSLKDEKTGVTSYCAEGAYREANGNGYSDWLPEINHDLAFFRLVTPYGEALWEFNDDVLRTKDEVVALFEKAIQKAKGDEANG